MPFRKGKRRARIDACGVKMTKRKLTLKEIREHHRPEIDVSDPKQRSRYQRTLDNLYACGLRLEEARCVARGSAVKDAIDYADRTGGKAITPKDQFTPIVHKTASRAPHQSWKCSDRRGKKQSSHSRLTTNDSMMLTTVDTLAELGKFTLEELKQSFTPTELAETEHTHKDAQC